MVCYIPCFYNKNLQKSGCFCKSRMPGVGSAGCPTPLPQSDGVKKHCPHANSLSINPANWSLYFETWTKPEMGNHPFRIRDEVDRDILWITNNCYEISRLLSLL